MIFDRIMKSLEKPNKFSFTPIATLLISAESITQQNGNHDSSFLMVNTEVLITLREGGFNDLRAIHKKGNQLAVRTR